MTSNDFEQTLGLQRRYIFLLVDGDVNAAYATTAHKYWTQKRQNSITEWCPDKTVWRAELSVYNGKPTVLQKMWRRRVNCFRIQIIGPETQMIDRQ